MNGMQRGPASTGMLRREAHLFDGLLDVLHGVGGDQGVEGLILARQHLAVLAAHLALLHGALAADHDLGAALLLDVLQGVATGEGKARLGVRRLRYGDL